MMLPAIFKSVRPVELLDRLLSISMTLLIAVVLVDPSDKILHAKVAVFCLIFLLWLVIKLLTGLRLRGMNTALFAFLIAVVIPSISLVAGLLENRIDDPLTGLAFLKAYLFFSLLIVVTDRAIALERLAPLSGIVALLTIAVFAVAMLAPLEFFALYQYSLDKENLMISSRDLGFGMFFYKTSPAIVFALALCLGHCEDGEHRWRNLFLALGCGFALLLSGTRANVAGGFAIVLFYGYCWLRRKAGRAVAYGLIAVLASGSIAYVAANWFSGNGNEQSDNIKQLHLLTYEDLLSEHPAMLIAGEGIGSRFRSRGAAFYHNRTMYDSELSYLELVRELGAPLALVVIGAFVAPVYLIAKRGLWPAKKHLVVAYLAYLAIAASNPLLISSTGMIVAVSMYSAALVAPGSATPARQTILGETHR